MKRIATGAIMILALGTASAVQAQTAEKAAEFAKGCAAGDMTSCVNLGVSYKDGLGVPKDPARALTLFEQACTAKQLDGCFYTAIAYHAGDGAPIDLKRAIRSYELACYYGSARGCYWNGVMWARGQGTEARFDMAIYMFKKALVIDPNHTESKDAIARLEKLQAEK